MSQSVTFRSLCAADLNWIVQLEKQTMPNPWSFEQIASEGDRPGTVQLVAENDQGVVGYLSALWVVGELEILRLAVDPGCRRQQVATGLVDALIARFRPNGLFRLILEVRADNLDAQAFYRRMAFEDCGCRKGYYADGADAVLMERRLRQHG